MFLFEIIKSSFYSGCYIEKMAATCKTKRFRGQNDPFGASLCRRGKFFFSFLLFNFYMIYKYIILNENKLIFTRIFDVTIKLKFYQKLIIIF